MITASSGSARRSRSNSPAFSVGDPVPAIPARRCNAERIFALVAFSLSSDMTSTRSNRPICVCLLIDADGNDPRRACALQTVSAGQHEVGVFALNVVIVEGISGQPVRPGADGDLFFQCDRRLSF